MPCSARVLALPHFQPDDAVEHRVLHQVDEHPHHADRAKRGRFDIAKINRELVAQSGEIGGEIGDKCIEFADHARFVRAAARAVREPPKNCFDGAQIAFRRCREAASVDGTEDIARRREPRVDWPLHFINRRSACPGPNGRGGSSTKLGGVVGANAGRSNYHLRQPANFGLPMVPSSCHSIGSFTPLNGRNVSRPETPGQTSSDSSF